VNGGIGDRFEAEKIQNLMFSMGYSWKDGQILKYLGAGYYFGYARGGITYTSFEQSFDEFDGEELKLTESTIYTLEALVVREKIKIGQHTYYKDEFEKAVANLKTV
jgi:hypothetical protein